MVAGKRKPSQPPHPSHLQRSSHPGRREYSGAKALFCFIGRTMNCFKVMRIASQENYLSGNVGSIIMLSTVEVEECEVRNK